MAAVWGGIPAQVRAEERWLLDAELNVGLPVTTPQRDLFGVGGSLSLGLLRTLAPWVGVGARVRTGLFLDGDPSPRPNVDDPGLGTLNVAEAALRFRLPDGSPRRGTGGWIELNGGGGFTGDVLRPTLGGGLGWSFATGDHLAVGPHVRYVQIIETDGGLSDRDARILLVGVSLTALDGGKPPPPPPEPPPPPDRDGDGIIDEEDACPDEPEDLDGFQDADGCPDLDNDGDGVLDVDDECPNEPEDEDGFRDEDGCPDPDNDEDGIPDSVDQCPFEPEVLNGIEDEDGCPDTGLIEMKDHRIVLEERVLFDTDRARVRSRGRPVLQAIAELARQHPEWTRIRIEGHADVRGNSEFNQSLSERRAINTREALVKFGMDPDRIVAEGFGARRPRRQGTTDEDHRKNRRVEFVVIASGPKPGEDLIAPEDIEDEGDPDGGEPLETQEDEAAAADDDSATDSAFDETTDADAFDEDTDEPMEEAP